MIWKQLIPSLVLFGAIASAHAATDDCDRACLSGFVTSYLDALKAHDSRPLPLTSDVRFTENGVAIPLGEALWVTITGIGTYRVDYVDTEAQQVASHVISPKTGSRACSRCA